LLKTLVRQLCNAIVDELVKHDPLVQHESTVSGLFCCVFFVVLLLFFFFFGFSRLAFDIYECNNRLSRFLLDLMFFLKPSDILELVRFSVYEKIFSCWECDYNLCFVYFC
jgi:hypothetical protein